MKKLDIQRYDIRVNLSFSYMHEACTHTIAASNTHPKFHQVHIHNEMRHVQ